MLLNKENVEIKNYLKDLVILKVGGSVFLKDNLIDIANFILNKSKDSKVVVVVSAIGRPPYPYSTNELIKNFNSILDLNRNDFTKDILINNELLELCKSFVISCGENISTGLLAAALNLLNKDIKAIPLNAFQANIITTDNFIDSDILDIKEENILKLIDNNYLPVICGFQGVSKNGYLTTLKRGGSDITAAFLAKKLKPYFNLKGVYIIKDIDSLKLAPPNLIDNPISINYCNYDELSEITYNGSQVVHNDAVSILHSNDIPLIITSVNSNNQTIVTNNYNSNKLITNISVKENISKFSLIFPKEKKDLPVYLDYILNKIHQKNISLDFIMLDIFNRKASFVVDQIYSDIISNIIDNFNNELTSKDKKIDYKILNKVSKVSVIGYGIRGKPGVMNRINKALLKNKIIILQAADSHISISLLIPSKYLKLTVESIYNEFYNDFT